MGAEGAPRPAVPGILPGARAAVVVLTAMNLLNYIDRYIPSALKDPIKEDLGLTEFQTGLLLSAFIVVYMVASPVFGALADRWPRTWLVAGGVALWSLATGAGALATGFVSLLVARALVGVGEASYATLAPSLLGDFYPPERRNRVLTIFYVALPVGAALSFVLGGWIGQVAGWRTAFLVVGLPGLLTAFLALRLRDPGPRAGAGAGARGAGAGMTWPEALRQLVRNRPYLFAVGGYTAVTFAAGGMGDWLVPFLSRHHGMDLEEAGSVVGAVTIAGGLGDTVVGGLLADRLRGRTRQPYLALSALSMVPATLLAAAALLVEGKAAVVACLFLAQFFLWFYNGPINTQILNSVPAALRVRAFSLSILCIHLFGDALSPSLIGLVSGPEERLPRALSMVPVAMAVGCLVWMVGWRTLPESREEE